MTAENFAYWMQGLLELNPDLKTLDEKQVKMIREHLALVMTKVTDKSTTSPPPLPHLPYQPYLPIQPSLPPYNPPFTPQWAAPIIECSTQEGQNQCNGTVADSVMTTYC